MTLYLHLPSSTPDYDSSHPRYMILSIMCTKGKKATSSSSTHTNKSNLIHRDHGSKTYLTVPSIASARKLVSHEKNFRLGRSELKNLPKSGRLAFASGESSPSMQLMFLQLRKFDSHPPSRVGGMGAGARIWNERDSVVNPGPRSAVLWLVESMSGFHHKVP